MSGPTTFRAIEHDSDPLFAARWSPRSFATDAIDDATLMRCFEAARWAPSAFNSQPWRFLYATRGDAAWDQFLGCLAATNRSWAYRAAALVLLVSKTSLMPPGQTMEVPSPSHSFDAGAAWANLANQAAICGWSAHAMGGFDRDTARAELGVPEGYSLEAMIAIGRQGDTAALPAAFQALERPSPRRPLGELVMHGAFRAG